MQSLVMPNLILKFVPSLQKSLDKFKLYITLTEDSPTVDKYLDEMMKNNKWAADSEIFSAFDLLKTDIYTLFGNYSAWQKYAFNFINKYRYNKDTDSLDHEGQEHFDVVKSITKKSKKEDTVL